MTRYASEAEFQAAVTDLARWLGWKILHHRPARTRSGWATAVQFDGVGWPDLLLVHPGAGRLIVAELKTDRGRLTVEQGDWLEWLEAAGVDVHLWRPSDWPEIEELLRASQPSLQREPGR